MSTISTTPIAHFLPADFTVIGSVCLNCLSTRMKITVEAKDIEQGDKILSNNSYSRKSGELKCLTWCLLSREKALCILLIVLNCMRKKNIIISIFVCHYDLFFTIVLLFNISRH